MTLPKFEPFSFFCVRLPFRPVNQLIDGIDSLAKNTINNSVEALLSFLRQPWIDEALFLASPDLYATWKSVKDHPERLEVTLENALWRYVFRAYGRSTPYGLFAGVGIGAIDENRQIIFGDQPWKAVSRPDVTVLNAISQSVANDKVLRPHLHYCLNNSLYEIPGQYRFSEVFDINSKRQINLSSLSITDDLRTLVDRLREEGVLSYSELINLYGSEFQLEVADYIDALIDAQFLLSNFSIPITGLDMTTYLLTQVSQLPSLHPTYKSLLEAQFQLLQSPICQENLLQIQQKLQTITHKSTSPGATTDSLIQTDLFIYPTDLRLDSKTVLQIASQFGSLAPILCQKQPTPLREFAERFKSRFDKQEIDLLTALDPEVGIGFSVDSLSMYPLLTDLPFPSDSPQSATVDSLEALRVLLYSRYSLQGHREIEITETDLKAQLPSKQVNPFPPSWYIHGELFNPKPSALTQESETIPNQIWRFVVNTTISTSSAYFLGRFCHGHASLNQAVKAMCAWEQTQYPTDILAEIVHLPIHPLRAGNVVARPVLRPFEIPYLTPSSLAAEFSILLSDLLVSVTDDYQVILKDKKTGQRVRPRHSSAHNPAFGDEVYQFLSYVHQDECHGFVWSWGTLGQLPILPRLSYRNLIISPAQWTLKKEAIHSDMITAEGLRTLYKLPRYVQLVEGDNKLLLDLDFEPAQRILLEEIRKKEKILLKEWLGETHQPWLINGADQHVSELIIPMKTLTDINQLATEMALPIRKPKLADESLIQRSFLPGQDWLYLKIYLTEKVADQILINVLHPLYQKAQKKRWCTRMFFIRYADPETHLRIRFQTVNNKHYNNLLMAWQQALMPYLESGLIKSVQLDTYQRELERYRPVLIDDCEVLFNVDSQFILEWLTTVAEIQDTDRYTMALLSADALLTDFGFTLSNKMKLSQHLQAVFFQEYNGNKKLKQKLNQLYRDHSPYFFNISSAKASLLEERSKNNQISVRSILNYFYQTPDDAGLNQVVGSLLHMNINRIFQGYIRRHELVIYHFLARHYESQFARLKNDFS